MKHTQLLLIFFLIPSFSFLYSQTFSYQDIVSSLRGASDRDASLLLNVAYWSYQRSQATIEVQQAMIGAFGDMWQTWQQCARTRLNPQAHTLRATQNCDTQVCNTQVCDTQFSSPDESYDQRALRVGNYVNAQTMQASYTRFAKAVAAHQRANAIYAQVVEHVVAQSNIEKPELMQLITDIRLQARNEVTKSLGSCLKQVKQSLHTAYDGLCASAQAFQKKTAHENGMYNENEVPKKLHADCVGYTKGVLDFVLQAVHGVSVSSFVRFDREYTNASELLFRAFLSSQDLFNQVWFALEIARAAYYKQCFVTISRAMVELQYRPRAFYGLFNEQGIAVQKQPLRI